MKRLVNIFFILLLTVTKLVTALNAPPKTCKNPSDDVVFYRRIGDPLEVNLESARPGTSVASCKFGFFGDYYLAANFNSDEWKDKIIDIGKNKTCSIKLKSITDEFFGEWTIWTIFNKTTEDQCEIYSDKLMIYPHRSKYETIFTAFKWLFGNQDVIKRHGKLPGPTTTI